MDVVLFCEADGERAFQGVEVFHGELHEFGAFCVVEEESSLWVLVDLGFAGFEGAGGAGGFGLKFEDASVSSLSSETRAKRGMITS